MCIRESTHLVLFAKLHLLLGAVGAAIFHATIQNLSLVGRGAPVGCSVCGKLLVKRLQNLRIHNIKVNKRCNSSLNALLFPHLSLVPFSSDIFEDNGARG